MSNIEELVKKPTSDKYILSKIRTNIIVYGNLRKYKKIDDIFVNDSAIILYENTAGNIGHWTCLVKRYNTISYFDSYGKIPDHPRYLKGKYPYLTRLLYDSPYKLEYNEFNYQRAGVATCGHHCIVRILFKNNSLEEYQNFMSKFKNDDEVVTAISTLL